MKKNIKNIIIVVVLLALAGVAYYLFAGKISTPVATTSSSLQTSTGAVPTNSIINPDQLTQDDASRISQQFVNQLVNLKAIKLNDDIFSSLAFQSLQDFSITLVQPGNEGRPNPFAPFDADGIDPNSSTTVSDTGIDITPVNSLPSNSSTTNSSSTLPASNNN